MARKHNIANIGLDLVISNFRQTTKWLWNLLNMRAHYS